MRRALLAAGLLVASAPAAQGRGCVLHRGERVVRSSDVAVVIADPRHPAGEHRVDYRACWRPTGRATSLGQAYVGSFDGIARVGPFAVSGRWVAFGSLDADRYGSSQSVIRLDAETGRHRRAWVPSAPQGQPEGLFAAGVRSVAVSAGGRVAWVASSYVADSVDVAQGDAVRRVDEGFPDTLRAVSFAGRELRWRHGGADRASLLPAACRPPAGLRNPEYRGDLAFGGNGRGQILGCEQSAGTWKVLGPAGQLLDAAGSFAVVLAGGGTQVYDVPAGVAVGEPIAASAALVDDHGSVGWVTAGDGQSSVMVRDAQGTRRLAGPDPFVWRLARDGSRLRWDCCEHRGEATMSPT